MAQTVAGALEAIRKVLDLDANSMKQTPAAAIAELRDACDELARKLDCETASIVPSRAGILLMLEKYEGKKFSNMAELCNSCLMPLLSGQIELAMQAELPADALEMLIPVLHFFNEFQFDLEDSTGAGKAFLQDWTTILGDALGLLESSGAQPEPNTIGELLQAVQGFQAFDSEVMAEASESLEARMAQLQDGDDD
eukprot:CAMPEP_0181302138 /NCGR_PEP_ID=MMETSP1101-20121128/7806_1 /TAXON_ID=46948 /ORGANISM="Rhodomonas abbreviata, Strain Caron Lab Isolate" /LENGTH=195 /DNA_ID=CAMNT_0023407507 /DNA_START=190 /DNA_END=774 /DNA_ORIENTATION=-